MCAEIAVHKRLTASAWINSWWHSWGTAQEINRVAPTVPLVNSLLAIVSINRTKRLVSTVETRTYPVLEGSYSGNQFINTLLTPWMLCPGPFVLIMDHILQKEPNRCSIELLDGEAIKIQMSSNGSGLQQQNLSIDSSFCYASTQALCPTHGSGHMPHVPIQSSNFSFTDAKLKRAWQACLRLGFSKVT